MTRFGGRVSICSSKRFGDAIGLGFRISSRIPAHMGAGEEAGIAKIVAVAG